MPNDYFQFKQFTVHQDRCAMKVGTDSVLIGALAQIEGASRLLDVGCGTGVVSLILAQRSAEAAVTGIELDKEAALQAAENVSASSWSHRINIVAANFNHYSFPHRFDAIVSNPPFFQQDLKCPDVRRNMARHTDTLTFDALLRGVAACLAAGGLFSVIIPTSVQRQFVDTALIYGLFVQCATTVYTKLSKQPKRAVLILTDHKVDTTQRSLVIHEERGNYSDDFKELMDAYYLHL